MNDKLTLKDIKKARKLIGNELLCPKCKTRKDDFVVLGHSGLFCKCSAELLCKTKQCKEDAKLIKHILEV